MNHRVFGRIKWDKEMERWTGQVKVDFFSSDDRGTPYLIIDGERCDW